jgi:hypothetical protein
LGELPPSCLPATSARPTTRSRRSNLDGWPGRRAALDGWRSTERRFPDGSIESLQWIPIDTPVVEHSSDGARELGRSYWLAVGRASRGLVHCREGGDGVELRLLGIPRAVLVLGPAELTADAQRVGCSYRITGGLLAARAGGTLTLAQTSGAHPEIQVGVRGFVPRLGALYDRLQRRLHDSASRCFFRQSHSGRRS